MVQAFTWAVIQKTCKKRKVVLRKRDVVSASHSRRSSNIDEHRRASMAGSKRHSWFGSVHPIRDTVAAMTSPAAKMYGRSGGQDAANKSVE